MGLLDKIAESSGGLCSQFTFRLASCATRFRRIKADKAYIRLLLVNADRVAIKYANISRFDWSSQAWR
jgi:hypothetical protein